tara:strand:- start:41 stop:430 length:390 start_codon:yes stop_codon:yes gene_type:complete
MIFEFSLKVYYEDTDSGGVVYYANYLKFIERARTNLIQKLGFTLRELLENYDCLFIVRKVNCDYLQSAKLEDNLIVQSRFCEINNASFNLEQNILRNEQTIFTSQILMVCVNSKGQPKKIPQKLKSLFK